eukprot:3855763-Amphidinium_carterae.1
MAIVFSILMTNCVLPNMEWKSMLLIRSSCIFDSSGINSKLKSSALRKYVLAFTCPRADVLISSFGDWPQMS